MAVEVVAPGAAVAPKYGMNVATREVMMWMPGMATLDDPKFVPYHGELPPIDFKTGLRIAKDETVAVTSLASALSEQERIERIAAVLHLVPKEEISEAGWPSLPVIEKLSGISDVKRVDVKAAREVRKAMLDERNKIIQAEKANEAANAAVEDGNAS